MTRILLLATSICYFANFLFCQFPLDVGEGVNVHSRNYHINRFEDGSFCVNFIESETGKCMFVDKNGEVLISKKTDKHLFQEGMYYWTGYQENTLVDFKEKKAFILKTQSNKKGNFSVSVMDENFKSIDYEEISSDLGGLNYDKSFQSSLSDVIKLGYFDEEENPNWWYEAVKENETKRYFLHLKFDRKNSKITCERLEINITEKSIITFVGLRGNSPYFAITEINEEFDNKSYKIKFINYNNAKINEVFDFTEKLENDQKFMFINGVKEFGDNESLILTFGTNRFDRKTKELINEYNFLKFDKNFNYKKVSWNFPSELKKFQWVKFSHIFNETDRFVLIKDHSGVCFDINFDKQEISELQYLPTLNTYGKSYDLLLLYEDNITEALSTEIDNLEKINTEFNTPDNPQGEYHVPFLFYNGESKWTLIDTYTGYKRGKLLLVFGKAFINQYEF